MAGVDEAGRGPIAGPLVVAAAILPEGFDATGLNDSKKLTAGQRDFVFWRIVAQCRYSLVIVPPQEVDRLNILRATLLAMGRSIAELDPPAAVVDGNQPPVGASCPTSTLIKGDAKNASIAAASILAKVTRDRLMAEAASAFPGYGFDTHFGYYNPAHREALARLGPCAIHRRSFEPVKSMLNQPGLF
ncbi:MAG: ribonuclease HII [Armatimonadetes bacterium]|nr:ribonuclease HII [Armatimonadota bacterium]MBS1710388.1 ribonuclease HII [Armatimonadota bacterium]